MIKYDEIISNIRFLDNGVEPLQDITDILKEHRCLYLLSKCTYPNKCYYENSFIGTNTQFVNEYFHECGNVFSRMNNIAYAVMKGAVLSKRAYGDICFRNFGDIDLLVKRENSNEIKNILLEDGFIQGKIIDGGIRPFTRKEIIYQSSQSHQTAPFVKKSKSKIFDYINIDLNFDIYWGEKNSKTDLEVFLNSTELETINNTSFKVLKKELDFIALCLHHYKHINSIYLLTEGSLNLSLFCDIYYYLKNNDLDIDYMLSCAKAIGADKYIFYCLYYISEIFKESLVDDFLKAFYSKEGNGLLDYYGLDDSELKKWNIDFMERLFKDDFTQSFYNSLDENEKKKVELNQQNM